MVTTKSVTKAASGKRAATVAMTSAAKAKPGPKAKLAAKPEPVAKATAAPKAAPKAAAEKPVRSRAKKLTGVSLEQRRNYVEVAAYHIAECRGFTPGNPLEDWAQAEAEIDQLIADGILGGVSRQQRQRGQRRQGQRYRSRKAYPGFFCAVTRPPLPRSPPVFRAQIIDRSARPALIILTKPTRTAVATWIGKARLRGGSVPFPEPHRSITPCVDAPICPNSPSLGRGGRLGLIRLWDAFDATYQGNADLQMHEEPESRSTVATPYQAGKHCPIPRYRGR